jgi:translation initiation factor eIF-2B subunit beta
MDSARLTVLLLRQVVSQRRTSYSGHAASLLEAVKDVGIRLISANPIG